MKTMLSIALLCATLGGCAVVPVGYDDGYYGNRHYSDSYRYRDHRNHYYGHFRDDDYYRHRWWRDDDRDDRYYSGGIYYGGVGPYSRSGAYFSWDHGQ